MLGYEYATTLSAVFVVVVEAVDSGGIGELSTDFDEDTSPKSTRTKQTPNTIDRRSNIYNKQQFFINYNAFSKTTTLTVTNGMVLKVKTALHVAFIPTGEFVPQERMEIITSFFPVALLHATLIIDSVVHGFTLSLLFWLQVLSS